MVTHQHHSARVNCSRRGDVAIADYSGALSLAAFESLRPRVVKSATGAACLVLRMDKALSLMSVAPVVSGYSVGAVPGAVIVRRDQYALWLDYSAAMAAIGIRRAVFLDSQLSLCRAWVDLSMTA